MAHSGLSIHDGVARQHDWSERAVSYSIGVGRIIWGATTTLAPQRVHNALGVAYPGADQGVWIKAFGIRDIVLGAAALHPDGIVRRAVLRAGIVMDVVDVGMVAHAGHAGLPRRAVFVGTVLGGTTAAFAAFGPSLLKNRADRSAR